jgi:hypothetical protein
VDPHRGILINRIHVDGLGGLIFTVGMMTTLLLAVPALRPLVAVSLVGGLLLAPVLWRTGHH